MPDSPLAVLEVLDLGRGVSASFCGRILADFGADVVKVEAPVEGDDAPATEDQRDLGTRSLHLYLDANKRSITLNLEANRGRDMLKRLAEDTDIVVEDLQPGYLDSCGIGHGALAGINPRLILTSISWFGGAGPYSRYKGCDIVAQAMGGLMALTGLPDHEPLKLPGHQSEYLAGLNAAGATLAALEWRDRSGEGQQVDISIVECVASALEGAVLGYAYSGDIRQRSGSRHPLLYPSAILPVKDGYVYVDAGGDLETLSRFLDAPGILDARFRDAPRSHADDLNALIAPGLRERSREELFHEAQLWRLPFGLVLGMGELLNDPQCVARDDFLAVENAEHGTSIIAGPPFRSEDIAWKVRRPAPQRGEHNEAVYAGRLGLSKKELASLRAEGVI